MASVVSHCTGQCGQCCSWLPTLPAPVWMSVCVCTRRLLIATLLLCGGGHYVKLDAEWYDTRRQWDKKMKTKCTSSVLMTTGKVDDAHIEHSTHRHTQGSLVKSYHLTISSSGRPIRLSSKSLASLLQSVILSVWLFASTSTYSLCRLVNGAYSAGSFSVIIEVKWSLVYIKEFF